MVQKKRNSLASELKEIRAGLQASMPAALEPKLQELVGKYPGDVRVWTLLGDILARQKRWQDAVDAFRRASELQPEDVSSARSMALCLLEMGRFRQARVAMGRVLKKSPLDSKSLTMFGLSELRKGSAEAALILLDRAVQLDIKNPALWRALGQACGRSGRIAAARAALLRAETLDPANPETYLLHSQVSRQAGKPDEAMAVLMRCHQEVEDFNRSSSCRFEYGMVLINLHRLDEARPHLEMALASDPDNVQVHLGMALLGFFENRWAEALREYRWRHRLPGAPRPYQGIREWRGEALCGKKLFVRAEQGAGDIIQFVRYLPMIVAQGAIVTMECPTPLRPLIDNMPGVSLYRGGRPDAELQVSLLDIPAIVCSEPQSLSTTFPYLHVAPGRKRLGRAASDRRRIAIAWAGNPRHSNSRNRDCNLAHFVRLAAQSGIEFISLEAGKAEDELETTGGDAVILPLGKGISDFADTAAALADVDLVISVDTALAHLAGAMGRPVWLLLPYTPDWRWGLEGEITPWYPTMRIFRQEQPGDWDGLFQKLADELAKWARPPEGGGEYPVDDMAAAQQEHANVTRQLQAKDAPRPQIRRALVVLARKYPAFAATWAELGLVLRNAGMQEAAAACYRRAIAYGIETAGVFSNLGNALNDLGRAEEAATWQRRALEIEPDSANCLHSLSISQRLLGQLPENLATLELAARLAPNHRGVRWDLCNTLLAVGRYRDGWKGYRDRWAQDEAGSIPFDKPTWDGRRFDNKTLLIFAEQGFGDTILAARFLPAVRQLGGKVVVCCQPELMRLIERMELCDRVVAKNTPPGHYDLQIAMMDLPGLFVSQASEIPGAPYLTADPRIRAMYENIFAPAENTLKIGIVWSGSVTFKGNKFRAACLEDFLALAGAAQTTLYSLQMGQPQQELKRVGTGALVTDLSPLLTDFDATAAVVDCLDLIIMTDSSVAHLAGALGKPVWNLLGPRPYWLWELEEESCPWYPSMRLIRKPLDMAWDAVLDRLAEDISQLQRRQPCSHLHSTPRLARIFHESRSAEPP